MNQSEDVIEALKYIPADLGRSDWLKVTTALKSLGASLKPVWEEWTSSGSSFKKEDLKVWDNCKTGSISIGTLFHYAKQNGYKKMLTFANIESKAIQAFKSNSRTLNQTCKDYFIDRGILPELIPESMRLNEYDGHFQIETPFSVNGSNKIVSIHRTAIDQKGQKVGKKWCKGKLPTLGIHSLLCTVGMNHNTIHIAEGIENILSIASAGIAGRFYAAGNSDQLKKFQIPPKAKTIHIWADNDKSKTGERAAKALANKVSTNCKVYIHLPCTEGIDFNDLLLLEGKETIIQAFNIDQPFCDKRRITSEENGHKGGKPCIDYLSITEDYITQWMKDNNLTLRFYNEGAYVFDGKCYAPYDGDVKADLMAYLQSNHQRWRDTIKEITKQIHSLRKKSVNLNEKEKKQLFALVDQKDILEKKAPPISVGAQNNVLENLKSFNFCHLSGDYKAPFRIIDPYVCEELGHVMSFTNGKTLLIDVYVKAMLKGDTEAAKAAVIENTPTIFHRFSVNYPLLFDAQCPLFMEALKGWQPEEEGRKMVQKMMGLSLTADTTYNVAFFLAGEGGTGKSTCLEIIRHLVGSDNSCSLPLQQLCGSEGRFNVFQLTENLLNIVGDMATDNGEGKGSALAGVEGLFKDTTDGGMVKCEHKGRQPYQARVTARHLFATNSLPRFSDTSEGLWDRLRIMPFNSRYRGSDKEIRNLKNKLKEELSGIFLFALQGYIELCKSKTFPEHPQGLKIKEEHRRSCDPDRVFLEENYKELIGESPSGNPLHTPSGKLYDEYKGWMRANGYYAKNQANFKKSVKRVFAKSIFDRVRISGDRQNVFLNVCNKENCPDIVI